MYSREKQLPQSQKLADGRLKHNDYMETDIFRLHSFSAKVSGSFSVTANFLISFLRSVGVVITDALFTKRPLAFVGGFICFTGYIFHSDVSQAPEEFAY